MTVATFSIINLGCKVNRVESDSFAAHCLSAGLQEADLPDAQLILVNTCAVTGEAEKKTRKAVRHACALNAQAQIVVTGCSAALHPEVFEEISPRVRVVMKNQVKAVLSEYIPQPEHGYHSVLPVGSGFRTRVGVKVQDGCNNACTYCIVHVARGKAVSRPFEEIATEVLQYAKAGAKEIVLTGINLGSYSYVYQNEPLDFAGLLKLLLEITSEFTHGDQFLRFRISSVEPNDLTQAAAQVIADSRGRICRHLHLPLQSGSTKVLKEMHRPYTAEEFLQKVQMLRQVIPGLSLSTDIIVGFPGETEQEFQQTCSVAQACAFSKIHVFPYSMRQGTPAAERTDQIDPQLKQKRAQTLREISCTLAMQDIENRKGTTEKALVESHNVIMTESYHTFENTRGAAPDSWVDYTFDSSNEIESVYE